MANRGYAWETRPDYIQACRISWPGGPTEYDSPRIVGEWEDDVTSFKAGQANWSEENLPDILYMIRPEPLNDWKLFRRRLIHNMRDEQGQEILEKWPRQGKPAKTLRDFPILRGLDVIGTLEHPLFLIALRRLDPAIEWEDLEMRMDPTWRPNLSQRVRDYWNRPFLLLNWHCMQVQGWNHLATHLPPQAIAANSTRGYLPGLINPALGEAGGRIHWPPTLTNGYGRGRRWPFRVGGPKREQYVLENPHLALLTPHLERDRQLLGITGPYNDPQSKTWEEWEREFGIESPETTQRAEGSDSDPSPRSHEGASGEEMEQALTPVMDENGLRALGWDPSLSPRSRQKKWEEEMDQYFPPLE